MNNEVLEILKEAKIAFETGEMISDFICNHIHNRYAVYKRIDLINNTIEYIHNNRYSFPEITEHPAFSTNGGSNFWRHYEYDDITGMLKSLNNSAYMKDVVFPQKVKYLKLLIAKLQSGFNIGDVVKKKSNKPFKNGEHTDTIIGFTSNSNHPNNKIAAILKDSDTIVCLNSLKLDNTII